MMVSILFVMVVMIFFELLLMVMVVVRIERCLNAMCLDHPYIDNKTRQYRKQPHTNTQNFLTSQTNDSIDRCKTIQWTTATPLCCWSLVVCRRTQMSFVL